jgi:hypothetical protein
VLGRSLRIDHVEKYKLPKKLLEADEAKEKIHIGAGHAYNDVDLTNQFSIQKGQDLFSREHPNDDDESRPSHDKKRKRKEKKKKKEKRRKHGRKHERRYDESSDKSSDSDRPREKQRSRHDESKSRNRAHRGSQDDDVPNAKR